MSGAVVGISGHLGARLGRAAGPRVIEEGNRGGNAVASRRGTAPVSATAAVFTVALLGVFLLATRFAGPVRAAVRFALVVLGCRAFGRRAARLARHPGNALSGRLFDRGDALGIRRRDHGDGGAGAAGASGTADAMDVVIGM